MTVFVDTNVWFSAFYGSNHCQKIVLAHLDGKIKAVISQDVLAELVRNTRMKIPRALPALEKLLKFSPPVIAKSVTRISKAHLDLADKKDLPILLSARSIGAKIFVTGNLKDFNPNKIKATLKMEVTSPKDLVKLLHL